MLIELLAAKTIFPILTFANTLANTLANINLLYFIDNPPFNSNKLSFLTLTMNKISTYIIYIKTLMLSIIKKRNKIIRKI